VWGAGEEGVSGSAPMRPAPKPPRVKDAVSTRVPDTRTWSEDEDVNEDLDADLNESRRSYG